MDPDVLRSLILAERFPKTAAAFIRILDGSMLVTDTERQLLTKIRRERADRGATHELTEIPEEELERIARRCAIEWLGAEAQAAMS